MRKMFIDLTTGEVVLTNARPYNSQYRAWRDSRHPEGLYNPDGTLFALSIEEFISKFRISWDSRFHPRFYLCEDHKAWVLERINITSSVVNERAVPNATECIFEFCYDDRRYAILIDMRNQERVWPKFRAMDTESLINLRARLMDLGIDIDKMNPTSWRPLTLTATDLESLTTSDSISEEIKKTHQKMIANSLYGSKPVTHAADALAYCYNDIEATIKLTVEPPHIKEDKKEKETMNKMDTIDEFYKYHTIYIHDDEIWFTYKNGDKGSSIIVSDKDGAKIVKEHKDEFILMLYQMHNFLPKSFLIFIPSEKKTIFRAVNNKEETVIKDSSKKKFDYIQAFFIGMTKYKMNYGKGRLSAVGYNWYDKLTNHRKIKEV